MRPEGSSTTIAPSGEPLRVLLVKPYQPTRQRIACPPLGLLYLASTLRKTFGADVEVRLLDLMVGQERYSAAREILRDFRPHVVGLSALNWEAEESGRFALMTQTEFPGTVVAIGGPFAHRNTRKICATGVYDWIFDGEADWAFPIACQRWFRGDRTMVFGPSARRFRVGNYLSSKLLLERPRGEFSSRR